MAVCASCAAPARLSISDAEIVNAAQARQSVDDVAHALELADIGALALPIPTAPSELRPDQAEFWQACAFAWNPQLRQARRKLLALRAASGSAGRPGPIMGQGMMREFEQPDAELEFQAMVDVIGLLGVGPASAARELAREQVRASLAELEDRVWTLSFDVDRARVRLASAKALEAALAALLSEVGPDATRIEILARRGWIGRGMTEGANAALHMIEHRQAMARTEVAQRRAELADLCGLDASHPALDGLDGGAIDRFRPDEIEWREPSAEQLLASLPRLRSAKLELAVAEAELQREARERWPMLRVGPRALVMPNDTILGGMFGIDIPFPGALDGRIEAAKERRDAAYEALEDALVAAQNELRRTREVYDESLALRDEHAPIRDAAIARMLVSAQATFQVDPEALERWSLAVGERVESLTALTRARADLVLAWLDAEQARGVRAEAQP